MAHDNDFAQSCVKNGFWDIKLGVKNGGDDCSNDRLRPLFDDALSFFLKEVCVNEKPCPLPVFLGDGKPVDLFKLFWMVRKNGGYDGVSENELWDFVAEECGLSVGVVAAIKLVYVKYLIEFDQWIWQIKRDNNLESEEDGVLQKLDLLVKELEGCRFSASRGKDNLVNDKGKENVIGLMDRNNSEIMEKVANGNDTQDEGIQNVELRIRDGDEKCNIEDNDEKCSVDDISIISCTKNVFEKVFSSRNDDQSVLTSEGVVERVMGSHKRKRESSLSLLPMLNWLAHAARNSNDPAVGLIPESSKWKDYGNEELWKQALLARKTLMVRRNVDSDIEESILQNKLRMHPSIYGDNNILNRQSSERTRSSKRLPLVKSSLRPLVKSLERTRSSKSLSTPCKKEVENKPSNEKSPKAVKVLTPTMQQSDPFITKPREKQVSVGPHFQAQVPAWTGVIFESDSKWLGTLMCPPQDEHKNVARNRNDFIGKGRESSCLCSLPGSTDCVRFHIAENRIKLSRELGPLFHRWKFNHMGEEVSLSWTIEEEKKFKLMVKSNTNSISKFWRNAFKFFPTKNREKLVSYYFNVHVIRKRSYQNRVTPNEIDSDNDEVEVGSVGDSFGYEKIHAPRIKCSQNMQCTNFD